MIYQRMTARPKLQSNEQQRSEKDGVWQDDVINVRSTAEDYWIKWTGPVRCVDTWRYNYWRRTLWSANVQCTGYHERRPWP